MGAARKVGGPGLDGVPAGLSEGGEQLPPLPAVHVAAPDQAGLLPGTLADAHLDLGDRRPRPDQATPRTQVDQPGGGFGGLTWVGDQGPTRWSRDGLPRVDPSPGHS